MTIWMISGLHNPRWLNNIICNFKRQKYKNKRLIIVENGDGIGVSNSIKLPKNIVLLSSGTGPAQPLNAALDWLRINANPNDWFCKADSDDYYGPGYLKSLLPAIKSGVDYAGRSSLYIRTTDNHLWFVKGKPDTFIFHGPTISGRIESSLYFPMENDWGEDAEWCIAMHAAGKKYMSLPAEHICYQRHNDYQHTWPCTDYEIRTSWKAEFFDLGPFDTNIVDIVKKRPNGISLGIAKFDFDNCMAVRILRERLQDINLENLGIL